jgi:hypothetical protein
MNSPLISFHSRWIPNAANIYFRFSFLLLILPAEASALPTACGGPTAYNMAFCIAALRAGIESPTTAPAQPQLTKQVVTISVSLFTSFHTRATLGATAMPWLFLTTNFKKFG